MTDRYALVGYPIDASPSPAMHNAAFRALGLDSVYELRPSHPEDVDSIVADLRAGNLQGANVTTPLKTHLLRHTEPTDDAKRAGAVNTLWMENGSLRGALTDVEGIRAPLRAAGFSGGRALLVGNGGAARAACVALNAWDTTVDVAARTPAKTADVLSVANSGGEPLELSVLSRPGALAPYDVILQATPVGREGGAHDLHWDSCRGSCVAFEMLYIPRRTAFLEAAATRGCPTIEGWSMLVAQGAESFAIWTGQPAPVSVMQRTVLGHLSA